jgi:hypothetical protein
MEPGARRHSADLEGCRPDLGINEMAETGDTWTRCNASDPQPNPMVFRVKADLQLFGTRSRNRLVCPEPEPEQ